jgi:transaldolase
MHTVLFRGASLIDRDLVVTGDVPQSGKKKTERTPPSGKNWSPYMNATADLANAGQSIWLDNITRDLLTSGTLARYIDELSVRGLTSNPTIYDKAIGGSDAYDEAIRAGLSVGRSSEDIFFGLAIDDLTQAADAFGDVHDRTMGVDGWVSLEVSPLLAHDTAGTVKQAKRLHAQADRPNLYIKIPGTPAGLPAIEEAIFAGIPVNVTLLFTADHYVAAAEAYMRGLERRVEAGLHPNVASVASVFMSRWDVATAEREPAELKLRLGIAIGEDVYRAYREVIGSDRWQRLANEGGRPQRLLFASTGTKDPTASDTHYISGLAAPNTVDTMPEGTLLAFADHGSLSGVLPADGGASAETLAAFEAAGIDVAALGQKLQDDGAAAFVASWNTLVERIASKGEVLAAAS